MQHTSKYVISFSIYAQCVLLARPDAFTTWDAPLAARLPPADVAAPTAASRSLPLLPTAASPLPRVSWPHVQAHASEAFSVSSEPAMR